MRTIKLLVLGGCHVSGYGLQKKEDCFIDIIVSSLEMDGVKFVKKTVPHFLYKNTQLLVDTVKEFQPELILFQMGNYEFTPVLGKEIKKVIGTKKKKATTSATKNDNQQYNDPYVGKDFATPKEHFSSYIKDSFKEMVNLFFPFSKRHSARFLKDISSFINVIISFEIPIIYLSVLPTLSPFVNTRRKKFNKRHLTELQQKNIILIDTHYVIPRKRTYFQDTIHLNKNGHQVLAEYILPFLKKIIDTTVFVNNVYTFS